MSVNRYQLAHLAAKGNKMAQRVLHLLTKPDRLIGLILLGNNFTNILITQLATYLGYRLYGDVGIAIATGILTFILLIFAELTPKTLAALHPQRFSILAGWIYPTLQVLTYPLVGFINLFSRTLLETLGVSQQFETLKPLDPEELRTVLTASRKRIPIEYQKMLTGVLDLKKQTVEDIVIPRNEIQGLDMEKPWSEIEEQIMNTVYTRMVVYKNNINNTLGTIHIREILMMIRENKLNKETIAETVRDPVFIPEGTSLWSVLINFKQSKRRTGLVIDEYGDVQGLITLEDLLEQIVGEFTSDPGTYDLEISRQPDGSVIVDGSCHIRELNRVMNWQLSASGPKTINGLILEYLENIPQAGTSLLIENHPFEIIKTQSNVIRTVKIGTKLKNKHNPDTS